MPLLSAFEDFTQRTLAVLPTLWEKLRFIRSLRDEDGIYRHWGLEHTFGEKKARAAIAQAYSTLIEDATATPLAELWMSAGQAAGRAQIEVAEFLNSLRLGREVLPEAPQGVPAEHYEFVVANLSRVARSRQPSTRSAA